MIVFSPISATTYAIVHPAGDPQKKYSAEYKPKGFSSCRLHKETFVYDQQNNVEATLRYLKEQGIPNPEVIKILFHREGTHTQESIQVIFAEPNDSSEVNIFTHGRKSHIGVQADSAIESYSAGKAFCLLSYPGVDGNPGLASQDSNADALDAAVEFLLRHKNFETENINFVGSSMGSETIINMLYRRQRINRDRDTNKTITEKFGKVALISPYLSLHEMAIKSIGSHSYALRRLLGKEVLTSPGMLYPFRKWIAKTFKDPIFNLRDSLPYLINKISSLDIYASRHDDFIPFWQSKEVYRIAKHLLGKDKVRFHEFIGFNHNEMTAYPVTT